MNGLNFPLRGAQGFGKKVNTFSHHNGCVYIEGRGKNNEQGSEEQSSAVFPKKIIELK
jgi:hypothetical protein